MDRHYNNKSTRCPLLPPGKSDHYYGRQRSSSSKHKYISLLCIGVWDVLTAASCTYICCKTQMASTAQLLKKVPVAVHLMMCYRVKSLTDSSFESQIEFGIKSEDKQKSGQTCHSWPSCSCRHPVIVSEGLTLSYLGNLRLYLTVAVWRSDSKVKQTPCANLVWTHVICRAW